MIFDINEAIIIIQTVAIKQENENRKLLDFLATRITFGESPYTEGSLIDYTITYIEQLEKKRN